MTKAPRSEVEAILARVDEKPSLARVVAAARQLDQIALADPISSSRRSVYFVRNYTVEPLEPYLKLEGHRAGLSISTRYSGYEPESEIEDLLEGIDAEPADTIVLALRLEDLAPSLAGGGLASNAGDAAQVADGVVERVLSLIRTVRRRATSPVLVQNFVMPATVLGELIDAQAPFGIRNLVRRMNITLAEQVGTIEAAYVADVDHLLSAVGLRAALDSRGARTSGAPLSSTALPVIARSLVRQIRALRGPAAKCVVVDADNTLWRGVIGEDGMGGIELGDAPGASKHMELQRTLLALRHRGVVLCIASKNESEDVLDVLRRHPDCLLGENDFAAMRINWEDKASNLRSLAEELNLGLEHMVFVDDNPYECEAVRTRLPDVTVVEWPKDVGDGTLEDLGLFDSLVLTEEDRKRTELYRAEGARKAARQEVGSVSDYLRSLGMVATVGEAADEHLPRLTQLIQRTNQFNLTTRRHDRAAIEAMTADPDFRILWLDLRDRFGGNGVVGCAIVRRLQSDAVLDTLLMSCRVIGRQVEAVLVKQAARSARELGASTLIGEYIPSRRNGQVADLYPRLGFEGSPAGPEGGHWEWDLGTGEPAVPDWFEVHVLEDVR